MTTMHVVWWRTAGDHLSQDGPINFVGVFTTPELAGQARKQVAGDYIDSRIVPLEVDPPEPSRCTCSALAENFGNCLLPEGKHWPDCPETSVRPDLEATDEELVEGQRAWMRAHRKRVREALIAQGKPVPWGLAEHERTADGEDSLPKPERIA